MEAEPVINYSDGISMQNAQPEPKVSLKKQMIDLLDKFLLGYISSKELINATIPMLMVSSHKRGRKSYIDKFLIDISFCPEESISREYIYRIRESIAGEGDISEKDRKKILKRTIKKLIERMMFEEIDIVYFLSNIYDVMCDFDEEIETEPEVKSFLETIRTFSDELRNKQKAEGENPSQYAPLVKMVTDYYLTYYKSVWDE